MRPDFAAPGLCFIRNRAGSAAGSIQDFDGGSEDVADAALGDDELGLGGIRLDLTSQPQDLHVDRAVVDLVVVYAARFQELVPREDPLRGGE